MHITIHRGANQIGGNCVEIATAQAKILLDLGMPLDFDDNPKERQEAIRTQVQEWCRGVDAIFISHYHADHHGLVPQKAYDNPVYMTEGTKAMLNIGSVFIDKSWKIANVQPIHPSRPGVPAIPVQVKDITVTAFTVDHSAYDACAFLIEAGGKRILYTGDVRLNGRKGILYKKLPTGVDYMLMEGTNISSKKEHKYHTENEVEDALVELFKTDPGKANFIWCSSQNIDRLVAIYRACKRTGKKMAVDVYTANVITSLWKGYQDAPRTKEFYAWADERGYDKHHIHTSGHAGAESLRTVADHVNPACLIPIHTESPEEFVRAFPEHNILILRDGKSREI